jgi:molybdopterin molybdotransferase
MTDESSSTSCADEHEPALLEAGQAVQRIRDSLTVIGHTEQVHIRAALDRFLAHDITSTINIPPYDNSAMDGYAVNTKAFTNKGLVRLNIVATVLAGKPYGGRIHVGECARIMTGGKIPDGVDAVVMQEKVTREGDTILVESVPKPGENIRRAGEDMHTGQEILTRGQRLTAADIGLLASLGIAEVKVYRRLRVAFFSTGDELRSLGEPLEEGQIYDSNRYTLYSMLQRFGAHIIDMGVIPDDRSATEQAFRDAANAADVLITSGGVSVGEADYVKETLDKMGKVDFWRIAMKPGRPLAFGHIGNCVFFGLPGNPVSAMVTFYQFVLPALQQLAGQQPQEPLTIELPCATPIRKSPGRMEFQRGIIHTDENGRLTVSTTGEQGSHILTSMSRANCFIVLPLENAGVQAGENVKVQPFHGIV